MRTSGILTIGGAFVAILGAAFSALMLKAFVVDKGQGFVDLSGLVVGVVVAAIGLALVAVGRKRARAARGDRRPGRMIRRSAAIALVALACAHAHPRSDEAHPDEVDADGVGDQRVSARAYHHYLDALLAKNADDFATAADELREAL